MKKKIIYNKNNVEVRCEFGDVSFYSPYLMIVKKDTLKNRKELLELAKEKSENINIKELK